MASQLNRSKRTCASYCVSKLAEKSQGAGPPVGDRVERSVVDQMNDYLVNRTKDQGRMTLNGAFSFAADGDQEISIDVVMSLTPSY